MAKNKIQRRSLYHKYLGERVAYLREKAGYTQTELQNAVNFSTNSGTISRIESGKIGITLEKVDVMSEILCVEPETLSYPSKLTPEEIHFVNELFCIMKHKDKAKNLDAVKTLLSEDFNRIKK